MIFANGGVSNLLGILFVVVFAAIVFATIVFADLEWVKGIDEKICENFNSLQWKISSIEAKN